MKINKNSDFFTSNVFEKDTAFILVRTYNKKIYIEKVSQDKMTFSLRIYKFLSDIFGIELRKISKICRSSEGQKIILEKDENDQQIISENVKEINKRIQKINKRLFLFSKINPITIHNTPAEKNTSPNSQPKKSQNQPFSIRIASIVDTKSNLLKEPTSIVSTDSDAPNITNPPVANSNAVLLTPPESEALNTKDPQQVDDSFTQDTLDSKLADGSSAQNTVDPQLGFGSGSQDILDPKLAEDEAIVLNVPNPVSADNNESESVTQNAPNSQLEVKALITNQDPKNAKTEVTSRLRRRIAKPQGNLSKTQVKKSKAPTNNGQYSIAFLKSFYKGEGKDIEGRKIEEIWAFSDKNKESAHNYIQWLFPATERSAFYSGAPLLTNQLIEELKCDPEFRKSLEISFHTMLLFYGFKMRSDGVIARTHHFKEKSKNWLTPGNHNHRRITRILKCMRLFGFEAETQAFYNRLKKTYQQYPKQFHPETIKFWDECTAPISS